VIEALRRRWVVAAVAALVVVAVVVVYAVSSGGGSSSKPLLITATAQPRDLRDQVTVQGTVERSQLLTVNSVSTAATNTAGGGTSIVSHVYLDDGATLDAGQSPRRRRP